ncbi:MAG: pantetheine-phosphate adenylyltransferase [Actinomycetota bacterium]|nr:pantetheine-phosphate adenylyltransferase [Actinomycetota bacterium]
MRVAVCPGSYDPITTGHLDIIERALNLYDKVVVGIAKSPPKKPLFSLEERIRFATNATSGMKNVVVDTFDTLVVEFARKHNAHVIIRGLRAVSDFEHEFQMAQLNRKLDPTIETLFMMASPECAYLSSSAVKEIAEYGGCVKGLVPSEVEESLLKIHSPSKRGGL